MSNVSAVELDNLRDAYLEMREEKNAIRSQVREEYRARIKAEIDSRSEIAERKFAVQLVRLREMGATQKELVAVIGDGTASTMRRYVELGGGKIAGRKTGAERQQERAEDIGVLQVTDTQYQWKVTGNDQNPHGTLVDVTVQWKNGEPYVWPVDGADVVRLRDDYGIERAELFEKGAEIVSAFGLTED